jgi:inner membrane transporter RhtA
VTEPARASRVPPHAYFLVSAVFHYLGPAFAVLLFARVDVLGVAWLRIASAAVVLAAWRRPWRAFAGGTGDEVRLVLAWGAVLALMNACFYEAIDKLPLGTVAAIEFLPGVYLVTDVQLTGEPLGVAFAAANALLFAFYIALAHRLAQHRTIDGTDALAASMLVAAIVITPLGGWSAGSALIDPIALAAGIGVGLCSSVIPYVTDQLAMARLPRATYALMVSLLPATATVIGIVVLAQVPNTAEAAGVALVVAGVALHRDRAAPSEPALTTSGPTNEEAEALVAS